MAKHAAFSRGDKVWEWTVIEPVRIPGRGRTYAGYRVECSCSTTENRVVREIYEFHLRSGNTKSCGHYHDSMAWKVYPERKEKTEGLSVSVKSKSRVLPPGVDSYEQIRVIRTTWSSIKDRCFNPSTVSYRHYGGRGITMYEPWVNDSGAFVRWVLENIGPRPEDTTASGRAVFSIDRIDVNGDYEPGNLRWLDSSGQSANTRNQLDPMNGIVQTPKASTFGFIVRRNREKFAEYGFETREDAAAGRDDVLRLLESGDDDAARGLIRRRTADRQAQRDADVESARREAAEKADSEERARKESAEARKKALEAENQARRDAKRERREARNQRWHEMNVSGMSLAEIARQEDVTVSAISIALKAAGIKVVVHNSTGYPGVKKNRYGTYEARVVIDGKRRDLGTRKTPEEAYELYLAAKRASGTPKKRTVQVRAENLGPG